MKKLKQSVVLLLLMIAMIFMVNYYVLAAKTEVDVNDFIRPVEYTDAYKRWIELSDTEKINSIQPKMYRDLNTEFIVTNPLYQVNLVGASVNSKFDLRDVIEDNLVIRNQYDTNSCWAFAGLSSLETNLALQNNNKIYDYSERHVNYATTRVFANGVINNFGFNRVPSSGGQWLLVENYLTSGQGAINEADMPFENNSDLIYISQIQDKEVQTRVYDTIYFNNYNELTGSDRTAEMNKIKQHIQNHGSVFASIHGDSSDVSSYNCYNNDTGAKYCNSETGHEVDHGVSIIGWDDNYAITNFAEGMRPSSKGAWIARNSWGENLEYELVELKRDMFADYEDECRSRGWNSASEIPDSFIISAAEDLGYTLDGDKLLLPVGDHGCMYISYEDVNVGTTLYGIEKASDKVDYDHIYQYSELYPAIEIEFNTNSTFICNVFDKESSKREFLTGVGITAPETYTCKVYVNPNGTSKTKADMQLVPLQSGSSEIINKGYHTLEFASPLEITGNQFVVVVEVLGTRRTLNVQMEGETSLTPLFDYVKTETGRTFISSTTDFDTCTWFDLGQLKLENPALVNGDSSLKAFTKEEAAPVVLDRIEIVTPPTRVVYNEGEDFEKAGLIIRAVYSDGTSSVLNDSDYSISDGTNLQVGQTSILITYQDKTVEQEITVVKKEQPTDPGDEPGEEPGEDPVEEPPEEKPTEEEKPVTTNFANAKCTLSSIKAYYYNGDSSKNYTVVDTKITGITRSTKNDKYEYYYYLSPKASLSNISDWVKIEEQQTSTSNLSFTVDSRDIPNYDEVSKATTLYIYIKEVVTKGGNQSVTLSKAIKYEQGSAQIETYVDGVKKTNTAGSNVEDSNKENNQQSSGGNSSSGSGQTSSGGTQQQQTQTQGQTKDYTTSPTKLPHTGGSLILIGIIIIAIVGIVVFVRYEVLNKYVK